LNQLAKIRDLVVIARTSMLQYAEDPLPIPEIAKALKVATVMECSVRYANGRVLITAQLIDGRTGGHLWSDEFNRDLTDVFAVQAEVAEQIALAMQVELLPDEQARIENRPTESAEAYQYYLHALSLPDWVVFPDYLPAYIHLLERSIMADPNFADAYAALAHGYRVRGDRDLSVEYAQKAIEISPTMGRAYDELGYSWGSYYARQDEALAAAERAAELSPNDPWILTNYSAHLAETTGDYSEAIRLGKRALAVDPKGELPCPCGGVNGRLGFIYLRAGDLEAAARHLKEAIKLEPDVYLLYLNLATVEYLNGDLESAKKNLNHALQILPSGGTYRIGYAAHLYGLLGEREQAVKILARQEEAIARRGGDIWRPLGWAALGTRDRVRALEEWTMTVDGYLLEDKSVSLGRISRFRDNWLNDPILEEPDFLELRRRLGFSG